MDTPVTFSSESDSDDESGLSVSSIYSDFEPETLKSHTKINTPRPSSTELQGILDNISNLDEKCMLEDIETEMKTQNNNDHKTKSKSSSLIPQPLKQIDNTFKRTETVLQTKMNNNWYINQYLCYKYLGKGAYGKVCLAKDIILKRKVAIKVFNKFLLRRKRIFRGNKPPTSLLDNMFREISIMKKLNHPNLIKI
eukprot:529155_1